MFNSRSQLKRKQKNYHALNKVGDVQLTQSITALSEVQQQQQRLDKQLKQTVDTIEKSALYFQRPTGSVLNPELMGNMSFYINELVLDHDQKKQALTTLNEQVDEQLKAVFKLKKTNQVVQTRIDQVQRDLGTLYFKQLDDEIADLRQNPRGK